mmetsp:Transcript_19830/g.28213  ORF Transcript_19830/g.28213 Transcript_19830/m.28213 type:complete len:119 (+) Transcript_19830:220-576(+)
MNNQVLLFALFVIFWQQNLCGARNLRNKMSPNHGKTVTLDESMKQDRLLEEPSAWSDCVGMAVGECENFINSTVTGSIDFELMIPGEMATMDYVWNRVRLYHDDSSPPLVTEPVPMRG